MAVINIQQLASQVHSYSDITAQNAVLVEQYKSQALQSESNAKASEMSTQGAQASVEITRKQVELLAEQVTLDKTEVNTIKFDSVKIAEQIAEDKATVQKLTDDFLPVYQQTVVDIKNAGDTQTERVMEAGKEQIESVNAKLEESSESIRNLTVSIETANTTKTDLAELVDSANKVEGDINTVVSEAVTATSEAQSATAEAQSAAERAKSAAEICEGVNESVAELDKKKITKFYASNLGDITLNDSDYGKITDMMVYGKSEQFSTQGYQLFKPDFYVGNVKKNNEDYSFSKTDWIGPTNDINYSRITLKPENNVYFENIFENRAVLSFDCDRNLPVPLVFQLISNTTTINNWGEKNTANINKGKNVIIFEPYSFVEGQTGTCIQIRLSKTLEEGVDNNFTFSNIMLELGQTAHDFEPYTGGIPSPNPDYPQEIQSVVNPVVKVRGKNLFDGTSYILGGTLNKNTGENGVDNDCRIRIEYVYVKKGTYTISNIGFDEVNSCIGIFYDKYKNYVSNLSSWEWNEFPYIFSVNEDGYVRFVCSRLDDDRILTNKDIAHLQIVEVADSEQLVTLPYTLNAIPVSSGGNITIDGKQYIADYVDVDKKQLVRMVKRIKFDGENKRMVYIDGSLNRVTNIARVFNLEKGKMNYSTRIVSNILGNGYRSWNKSFTCFIDNYVNFTIGGSVFDGLYDSNETLNEYLKEHPIEIVYELYTPFIINLTDEEVQAFKNLASHYPTTNVLVTSDQLDGYTTFNYPLSMANGWNLIKEQLGDTREYIYYMDLQSAEAYVNSEYAVALTELEVL
ncbi:MAG: hypothetical protein ACI4F9_00915 [Lachnospiraceae bacterium]